MVTDIDDNFHGAVLCYILAILTCILCPCVCIYICKISHETCNEKTCNSTILHFMLNTKLFHGVVIQDTLLITSQMAHAIILLSSFTNNAIALIPLAEEVKNNEDAEHFWLFIGSQLRKRNSKKERMN